MILAKLQIKTTKEVCYCCNSLGKKKGSKETLIVFINEMEHIRTKHRIGTITNSLYSGNYCLMSLKFLQLNTEQYSTEIIDSSHKCRMN